MNELTEQQQQQIGDKLASTRAELLKEIRNELEGSEHAHHQNLAGEVADAGDASVAEMLMDFDLALVKHQVEELLQVERAQKRFVAGEINTCEQCGEWIGYPRLVANPAATRCIACQEQYEQFYRQQETPKS